MPSVVGVTSPGLTAAAAAAGTLSPLGWDTAVLSPDRAVCWDQITRRDLCGEDIFPFRIKTKLMSLT